MLDRINVLQYFNLKDTSKYDAILGHLKPKNVFLGKEVNILRLPYNNVKYCLSLLQNINDIDKLFEVFNIVFECERLDFEKADVTEYFYARNYIIESFKLIIDNEKRLSQGGNTDLGKWQMAGGDRLKNYDSFLPLDQLGERYGQYPFDLGMKPYSDIFYLMAMTKTLNEVNYNYNTMK